MTSIYTRATPRQHIVMRMVEGAVRNAAHAHRNWPMDERFPRIIAKRAAGTLTAGWPDVLAAPQQEPSVKSSASAANAPAGRGTRITPRKGAPHLDRRSLHRLHVEIGHMAGEAMHSGRTERHAALVDVLRLIAGEVG